MSLGAITLEEAPRGKGLAWFIECQPHVAIKLKRVFAKLGAYARTTHFLSDTAENARDLEWFLDRYPLAIDGKARAHLQAKSREHQEQTALVAAMLARSGPLPTFDLALPAREYQKEFAALALASGGLLLADDLGLGKTVSAICTLTDPRTRPAVVVTETHLPEQWRRMLYRFAPQLRAHILQGTRPYSIGEVCKGRHRFIEDRYSAGGARCRRCFISREDAYHGRTGLPDVILTSYSKLPGWAETLAPLVKSVIFDEAQHMRRRDNGNGKETAKYASCKHVRSEAAFCNGLTATPVFNMGAEIFNVLDVIKPGCLGERGEFLTEWCDHYSQDQARIKDPKAFGVYAREAGFMLRRTRAEVGRELPPLSNITQPVEADLEKLDQLTNKCAELARFILGLGSSPLHLSPEAKQKGEKMLAGEELSNRLRQATGIAKAPFVAEFVRLLVAGGEKVVLFGWHRQVYDIWLERLADLKPVMYTGSETAKQKDAAREAFVTGDAQVLIMSLRSGAGLDGLQDVCHTVAYGELDWSPKVHDQCTGRVFRDGQTQPVFAFYLMADVGIDPVIADTLGVKEAQSHGILNPNADMVELLDSSSGGQSKKLAAAYLAQLGETVPENATEERQGAA